MPQLDLETLVCGGGGDRKVSCETLIDGGGWLDTRSDTAAEDPDFPAESFQVPIGGGIDWPDLNSVYDLDVSIIGAANPKWCHSNSTPRPGSQRPPAANTHRSTIQQSGYCGRGSHHPPLIFTAKAGRSEGGWNLAVPGSDPASPKVSCFGRVMSGRRSEPRRRRSEEEGKGWWAGVAACFGCAGDTANEVADKDDRPIYSWKIPGPAMKIPAKVVPVSGPPSLAGMKRFASERKAASWGWMVDVEADGSVSEPPSWEGVWSCRRRYAVRDGVWDGSASI